MESSTDTQLFKIDDFEGPLDLLLFLVRKNEVNVYDIPIALITEQFLNYISLATQVNLDNLTDFYQMAATLLYIKSRMLLPIETDLEEEMDDPRKELVEKLIEFQKYKKLATMLTNEVESSDWLMDRKKPQTTLPFDNEEKLWTKMEVWDLLKTFSSIMKNLTPQKVIDLYEEVSINEKVSLLLELLESKDSIIFADLIINKESIMEFICSFLAILELVKSKRISIFQHSLFGDIQIKKALQGEDSTNLEDKDERIHG